MHPRPHPRLLGADRNAPERRTRHDHDSGIRADVPFNWPPIHGGKIAPALAAGNTVVLKPSEQDPLTVMRIVELLNTVLPEDVLHAVPGNGSKVGQPLAAHPLVRTLTFTGSTGAGAAVAGTAAKNITPALLELGGKDAMIVFDDADLDRALKDAVEGGYYNKGEACTATSRILVQDAIYDSFVERLAAAVMKLEIFGPVVTVTHFSDEDEAVAIVNESEYGLTSAIYTADSTRGFRVARRIDVGMVPPRARDRNAAGVHLHEDRPLPVGPRNDPCLARARRHIRGGRLAP
jgi:acyl-CoA reductase-like NAD-dependent aldehyde dehydrogenase